MRAAAFPAGQRGGENEARRGNRQRVSVSIAERVDPVERRGEAGVVAQYVCIGLHHMSQLGPSGDWQSRRRPGRCGGQGGGRVVVAKPRGDAIGEDDRFQQRVRGKSVGAVRTSGGAFADDP